MNCFDLWVSGVELGAGRVKKALPGGGSRGAMVCVVSVVGEVRVCECTCERDGVGVCMWDSCVCVCDER